MKKKIIAICLSLMMTAVFMPSSVLAADNQISGQSSHPVLRDISVNNLHIHNVEKSRLKAAAGVSEELPDKYDSRDVLGATAIKDQRKSGLCWAFSTSTATEYAAKKAGLDYNEKSPGHLGYFYYNRLDSGDPLGNTAGDKNVLTYSEDNWYNAGGNRVYTFQALANWGGMAKESNVKTFENQYVQLPPLNGYDSSYAFQNNLILKNGVLIDASDRSAVKQAIKKYGSVVIGYYEDGYSSYTAEETNSKNEKVYSHYYNGKPQCTHEVTVVGWDDNYSRRHFTGASGQCQIPSKDGAWIIQNSWGNQYKNFYISYEDTSFAYAGDDYMTGAPTYLALALEMQDAGDYEFNYQHDGTAGDQAIDISSGNKLANVFEVKNGDMILSAVGFTTYNNGSTAYTVRVFSDLTSASNPESGTEKCSFTVHTDNSGSYTFEIPGDIPIALQNNTKFSISIEAKVATSFGIEETFPDEYSGSWLRFVASTASGESFKYSGGRWTDLNTRGRCARIKGFANSHIHDKVHHEGQAATCTEAGWDEYDTCNLCDYSTYKEIPALGHDCIHTKIPAKIGIAGLEYDECERCGKTLNKKTIKTLSPAGTSISKLVSYRKAFTVKWKKKPYTGYQIRYSLKSSMSSAKKITISKAGTLTKKIKKLKDGKKYYVQIRTYKTVNGTKYYSKWSTKKYVRTKK